MEREMQVVTDSGEIDIDQFFCALPEGTRAHCERVARSTVRFLRFCEEQGDFPGEAFPEGEKLYQAVLYHDIGKALIPERLLNKLEELTAAEWNVMKRHTSYGARLLEKYRKAHIFPPEEDAFWRLAGEIAAGHHERWDGKGYPFGQLATANPAVCRAVAIIDTYDAIVTPSPYRMGLPLEYARLEIVQNAGAQFDPQMTELFRQYSRGGLYCPAG